MKSIVYRGPDRAISIDGKRLERGISVEVSNELADELLGGSERLGSDEHEFVEKKSDDKDADTTERAGHGIAGSQPDATTRADQ